MPNAELVVAIALEPDSSSVRAGEVAPIRINIPTLNFTKLAELLENEIISGDQISVRFANDYLDMLTLQNAFSVMDELTQYCQHTISLASYEDSDSKEIDIRNEWAAKFPLINRSEAPPPGILFFTVSGSSMAAVGVWMTILQMCFGRDTIKYLEGHKDADENPMYPALKKGFEDFFGMPFMPIATISNLGPPS